MVYSIAWYKTTKFKEQECSKKSCYFSSQKKKRQNKTKAKASKTFGIPLCKQANKNKRTGKGVGTILFPVHVTFLNHDLLARVSN